MIEFVNEHFTAFTWLYIFTVGAIVTTRVIRITLTAMVASNR